MDRLMKRSEFLGWLGAVAASAFYLFRDSATARKPLPPPGPKPIAPMRARLAIASDPISESF